ncbi:MAG TPA: translation initiation factor IF-2 [Chlamydiales bacterium]|nr:translation initiation factor IF-2 [Chlamydiales bacterium]
MGKNLKLNIKNTQLAEAFKVKKAGEPEPETTKKKEAAPSADGKRLSRLKEDASIATAIKQAEKTLATREREGSKEKEPDPTLIKKRKARIVQGPPTPEEIKAEAAAAAEAAKAAEEAPPISKETSAVETPSTEKPVEKQETGKTEAKPPAKPPAAIMAALSEGPQRKEPPPKELRAVKKKEEIRFDSRDRQGLRDIDNEAWRKRRAHKPRKVIQEEIVRPKSLSVRLPITIKDLAHEMKLKASQLIAKLFMQGITLTLNDYLDDETVVQLLGHDFECEIKIDRTEQARIRITDHTIRQEIDSSSPSELILRSPVVTFMGHVDHGKTSLIDTIRKSNRAAGEAGAITQHIGAFKVATNAGDVTILDTPGHEAFSEMRSRGANVTDIVILVIAGDEGIRAQTEEAIRQAREAKVPILVAMNKADKPTFDLQKVYRELADRDLLPEAWGGTTITVSCSAVSGQGIKELLEMIALQAEILELRASPNSRARGTVLESEMHKGLGAVATVLVQNGTLRKGDAIVFGHYSGRIKTMQDDHGLSLDEAGPSTPVKITGLSELALAGHEFIVVKNEKEARELASARAEGHQRDIQSKPKLGSLEKMMAKRESGEKKILPLILRADVQGSLEALKNSLLKIQSDKVRLEIVSADVGEISESDIELANASKATIVGFHTSIESHAEDLIKQKKIPVYTQDVIYHLIDEVRNRMRLLLDKIEQENDVGEILVKAVFKSSQLGLIAGCQVTEGTIKRQNFVRQIRDKEIIWKGKIASLKRMKEDVKEVQKGFECGILLEGQTDIKEGDILQAYEITYLEQDL